MRLHISALAVLVSVVASGLPLLNAQSLGEVARQEEERRKGIKAEAKVYTNKDLQHVPATASIQATPAADVPPVASGTGKDTEPQAAGAEGAGAPEASPRDQAYWGGRMKELRTNLERTQTYAEALQSRINALTTDFVNRDDPAQRAMIASDRNRALAELERLKIQSETDRKAIAVLEEEARRAGVPPGWLR
jgi:hypothetical protein